MHALQRLYNPHPVCRENIAAQCSQYEVQNKPLIKNLSTPLMDYQCGLIASYKQNWYQLHRKVCYMY